VRGTPDDASYSSCSIPIFHFRRGDYVALLPAWLRERLLIFAKRACKALHEIATVISHDHDRSVTPDSSVWNDASAGLNFVWIALALFYLVNRLGLAFTAGIHGEREGVHNFHSFDY
jgi:hypothetical protein